MEVEHRRRRRFAAEREAEAEREAKREAHRQTQLERFGELEVQVHKSFGDDALAPGDVELCG